MTRLTIFAFVEVAMKDKIKKQITKLAELKQNSKKDFPIELSRFIADELDIFRVKFIFLWFSDVYLFKFLILLLVYYQLFGRMKFPRERLHSYLGQVSE